MKEYVTKIPTKDGTVCSSDIERRSRLNRSIEHGEVRAEIPIGNRKDLKTESTGRSHNRLSTTQNETPDPIYLT